MYFFRYWFFFSRINSDDLPIAVLIALIHCNRVRWSDAWNSYVFWLANNVNLLWCFDPGALIGLLDVESATTSTRHWPSIAISPRLSFSDVDEKNAKIWKKKKMIEKLAKDFAPGEARTHGLQIMRLTRCLLRYRGLVSNLPSFINFIVISFHTKAFLPKLSLCLKVATFRMPKPLMKHN